MSITRLRIANFKSFRDSEVTLSNFNVIIGANGSGKSNFVQFFRFLKDINAYGLDNAVSLQGGIENLINHHLVDNYQLSIEILSDDQTLIQPAPGNIFFYEPKYNLYLELDKSRQFINQRKEKMIFKAKVYDYEERLFEGDILVYDNNGDISVEVSDSFEKMNPYYFVMDEVSFFSGKKLSEMIKIRVTSWFNLMYNQLVKSIAIFDFDPKIPKRASPINVKLDLEENGSNLVNVLQKILQDSEKRRKLMNLVQDVLPTLSDIEVDIYPDRSLMLKLKEVYGDNYLPSFLISDGTINIIALIVALYFENKPLIIIEEIERNIHPYLMSRVVEMMKEASQHKQIIVTTHNPEILKYTELENILLIGRDQEGFSQIIHPSETEEIKVFLENEIGINDLYVNNLLRV